MDQDKIREVHRTTTMACAGITAVPFMLSWVGYLMYDPTETSPDPVILAVFGVLALAPIIGVPLYRRIALRAVREAVKSADGPAGALMVWSLAEYALWEVSSLLGFVGLVLTGQIWFMAACVTLTLVGYAFSFPRWSKWAASLADLGPMAEASAPAPL